jgi:hypothetical protein
MGPAERGELGWRALGLTQHVTGDRQQAAARRFEGLEEYAEKAEAHLWIVNVTHTITDDLARRIAREPGTEPLLDAESVAFVTVGCYRCEEPLAARLLDRRCKGEPRP